MVDADCFQMASKKFTEPFDESDVSLSVEGKLIYANKSILSMWSPVFKTMFGGGFKESNAKVVQLPEKYFKDILELMCILHPPNKPVDGMLFIFQAATHQKTKKLVSWSLTSLFSTNMAISETRPKSSTV